MMNPQPQSNNTQPTFATTARGVPGEAGSQFEIKMAAVIGLRGLKEKQVFELSSNREDAGNFDDIVYTANGRRYFLQLKHTYSPNKNKLTEINLKDLLPKCFKSYCDIKDGGKFVDIHIDNSHFVIYTNKELSPEFSDHEKRQTELDIIFKTSDEGIFNFNPDQNHRKNLDPYLKKEVEKSETLKDLNNAEIESLFNEFLNKLIIATGQKSHWKLDKLIAEEILNKDEIKVADEEYNSILHHFETPLGKWWRNKKRENMTPEMLRKWLQRAKTEYYSPVVNNLCNSYTIKLISTRINFSNSEISRLQAELSNKCAVHLRSNALTLCSILLLDCLDKSKCIFVTFESLQSTKKLLLHAWLGGIWQWLIVFCDSAVQPTDISKTCLDIDGHNTSDPPTKFLIIVTHSSVQKIDDSFTIDYKFKFEHLSVESQDRVLDKKIDFQGFEVTMKSVLPQHGNVEHVLGPEVVTELISEGTAVNIGGKLQENKGHSAPRFLEIKIYLRLEVLQNPNIYREIFAVSGITGEELLKIVYSFENLENFSMDEEEEQIHDENMDVRFIVLAKVHSKSHFSYHCQNKPKTTLHWLKYIPKYGKLLWKQSQGATDSLIDYFDLERRHGDKTILRNLMKTGSSEVHEKTIWDLGERTVLVVADPGMGKSSTTTEVAWHTKLADPTSWVLRINWNDHTRKLQEINAETFNLDTLVEFLCSAAFPESKYTDINNNLLKHALQTSGNVTVLMDGFDEISPLHTNKAAVILSELMKTKVERVWVTSRPVQKERLEKELSVIAFSMKKLSYKSQINVFMDIWKSRAQGNKVKRLNDYVRHLLMHVNESVYQRNFTSRPLHIMLIASASEENLETYLKTGNISLPDKLNLLELYDKFFERKLHIDETEENREDLTNAGVQDDHEMLKKIYVENLEKCGLLVTLPSGLNPLRDAEMQTTIQPFVERLQAGNDKICTVMNVVEKRPHFVHRLFAEYWTARWFSKNIESNRNILEHILFDCSYGIVKDVFDRILARGYPLHCAVLEEDTTNVRTLIQEKGHNVNAVDNGGRTVMHIIAIHHSKSWDVINQSCNHEVSLDIKDRVLQWTPLQYAIKSENWFIVERLLERNADRSGLDMIRQRIHDPDYITSIVRHSAEEKHVLLLAFLRTIGV